MFNIHIDGPYWQMMRSGSCCSLLSECCTKCFSLIRSLNFPNASYPPSLFLYQIWVWLLPKLNMKNWILKNMENHILEQILPSLKRPLPPGVFSELFWVFLWRTVSSLLHSRYVLWLHFWKMGLCMSRDWQDQIPGMWILQVFEASNAKCMPKCSIMSAESVDGLTQCLLNISQANKYKDSLMQLLKI